MVVLFQAEDGIRDLVRSRGLGDVYKRQQDDLLDAYGDPEKFGKKPGGDIVQNKKTYLYLMSVSYTHLTLPTSDLV